MVIASVDAALQSDLVTSRDQQVGQPGRGVPVADVGAAGQLGLITRRTPDTRLGRTTAGDTGTAGSPSQVLLTAAIAFDAASPAPARRGSRRRRRGGPGRPHHPVRQADLPAGPRRTG